MRNAISFLGTTLSAITIIAIAFVAIVVVHGSLSSVTSIVNGLLSSHTQIEVAKEETKQIEIEWTERTKQTQIEWNARTNIAQIEGDTTAKVEHIRERSTFWYNIRLIMIVGGLLLLGLFIKDMVVDGGVT